MARSPLSDDPERGARIRRWREQRGLKQEELGARVGLRGYGRERSVQKWEAGKPITWPNVEALADEFGVSTNDILGIKTTTGSLERRVARLEAELGTYDGRAWLLQRAAVTLTQVEANSDRIQELARLLAEVDHRLDELASTVAVLRRSATPEPGAGTDPSS